MFAQGSLEIRVPGKGWVCDGEMQAASGSSLWVMLWPQVNMAPEALHLKRIRSFPRSAFSSSHCSLPHLCSYSVPPATTLGHIISPQHTFLLPICSQSLHFANCPLNSLNLAKSSYEHFGINCSLCLKYLHLTASFSSSGSHYKYNRSLIGLSPLWAPS